jgi:transcriptional regulator with XRE-family HTH domain
LDSVLPRKEAFLSRKDVIVSQYPLRVDRLTAAAATRGDRSRYAISRRTGLAQSTLWRLFHGTATPSMRTLVRLSQAYGVEVADLVDAEPVKESA